MAVGGGYLFGSLAGLADESDECSRDRIALSVQDLYLDRGMNGVSTELIQMRSPRSILSARSQEPSLDELFPWAPGRGTWAWIEAILVSRAIERDG